MKPHLLHVHKFEIYTLACSLVASLLADLVALATSSSRRADKSFTCASRLACQTRHYL